MHRAGRTNATELTGRWQQLVQAITEHLERTIPPQMFLSAVLPMALETANVDIGWVFLAEGETWKLAGVHGLPPPTTSEVPPFPCLQQATQAQKGGGPLLLECDCWTIFGRVQRQRHASVPLSTRNRLIGVLNAARADDQDPPPQDLERLTAVSTLLALALDRLTAQTPAAPLERSHTLFRVLSTAAVQVQNALDVDEILAAVGENLKQAGIFCAVALIDAEQQTITLRYTSADPNLLERVRENLGLPEPDTWTLPWKLTRWWPGEAHDALLVQNGIVLLQQFFPHLSAETVASLLDQIGISRDVPVLYAPLRAGGMPLGLFFAWGPEWKAEDLTPFTLFCAELSAVIRAAQLGEQVRAREQELLLRHAHALLEAETEEVVVRATVEVVKEALSVPTAVLLVPEPSRRFLVVPEGHPEPPFDRLPVDESQEGEAFRQQTVVQWTDRPHAANPRFVAGAIVPLPGASASLGVLGAYSDRPRAFDKEDLRLLTLIASQAATVIERLRARRAAAAAEAQYCQLFESVPVGLYRSTPDGRVLSVNQALVDLLGYPDRETLLNTPAHHLYADPAERERWKQEMEHEGTVRDFETRLRRYDGSIIWVRDTARAVRDLDGRVLCYDGMLENITAIKEAEQEHGELLAALQQRTVHLATLNAVIVAAAGATNLPSFLQTVLDKVLQAFDLEMGGIWLAGGPVALRNLSSELGIRMAIVAQEAGIDLTAPVVVSDWEAIPPDAPYSAFKPVMADFGVRASIIVPVFGEGKRIGGLSVAAPQPKRWSRDEVVFLEAVGQQVGVTVGRIRLLQEAQQRAQLATKLAELATALNRSRRLEEVVPLVGRGGQELSQADRAALYMREEDGTITCPWFSGLSPTYITAVLHQVDRLPGAQLLVRTDPILIPDIRALPQEAPLRSLAEAEGYRAVALWPLVYEGCTIAALGCYYNTPHRWSDLEREFIETFCRQAALAIVNARLTEAEQRQRRILAELLEMIQTVGSSLDIKEVLRRAAQYAARLCQAQRCSIFLLEESAEGKILRPLMSQFADGHTDVALWKRFKFGTVETLDRLPSLKQVAEEQRPLILNDLEQAEPTLRAWAAPFDVKSLLAVPLVVRGETIGIMVLDNTAPYRHFTPEQADMATTIGDRVAASIENARLYTEQQRLTRQLISLHRATASLLETLETETLAERILNGALMLVSGAQRAALLWAESPTNDLRVVQTAGYDVSFPTQSLVETPLIRQALRVRRPILGRAVEPGSQVPEVIFENGSGSAIAVPLLLHEHTPGVLLLEGDRPDTFTEEDLEVLAAFASTAAVALHNAWLYTQVQELAMTDALTGLYNRRALFLLGQREVERARRFGRPLTAIMFDLDHFKRVNDTHGHVVGDQVLVQVAHLCQQELRRTDLLCRYGGEEFVALLPETNVSAAWQVAERVRQRVAQRPLQTDRGAIHITVSLGVAFLDSTCPDLETLIERADQALYAAKQAGRNCVRLWPHALD